MHIEVNHDNHVVIPSDVAQRVSNIIGSTLDRFADRITRVEVHLGDNNAAKHGANDKRCMVEARLAGLSPIAVTHEADDLMLAIDGATEKIERAIEHAIEKQKA